MPADRETVLNGLLTVLGTVTFAVPLGMRAVTTWASTPSRRLKLWNQIEPEHKPCLFQVEHDEDYQQSERGNSVGLPRKTVLDVSLVCYFKASDDEPGGPTINTIIKAIEDKFKPDSPQNTFSIGGLVYRCWIQGKVFKDPGDIDNDGILIVPVKILMP